MILYHDFFHPTAAQRKVIKEIADDSFVMQIPHNFGLKPSYDGYETDDETGIALKCKNVDPHTDEWVGRGDYKDHLSIFWLTHTSTKHEYICIQVGEDFRKMKRNDYVVFDSRILHSVISDRVWCGVAYQCFNIYEKTFMNHKHGD